MKPELHEDFMSVGELSGVTHNYPVFTISSQKHLVTLTIKIVCFWRHTTHLWGKFAVWRSFVVSAESENTAMRADSAHTTNNDS